LIETLIASLILSKMKLSIEIWKIKIHKKSYNIKPLFKLWCIYPVLFMSILYIIFQIMILYHNYNYLSFQRIFKDILIYSYMLLGMNILIKNETYKPFIISCGSLLTGFGLNGLAMYFNNNIMPIYPDVSYSTGYTNYDMIINSTQFGDFHILGNHETNLIFLCDVFDFGGSIWSVGDIFIRLYAFIIVYYSIKTINSINKK